MYLMLLGQYLYNTSKKTFIIIYNIYISIIISKTISVSEVVSSQSSSYISLLFRGLQPAKIKKQQTELSPDRKLTICKSRNGTTKALMLRLVCAVAFS